MLKVPRRRKEDSAAVAVEFALTLPILMLILFGLITAGYILSFRQDLSQAAASGARAAAGAAPSETIEIKKDLARKAVDRSLAEYGIQCDVGIDCNITSYTCGVYTCVKIELVYDYSENPLIPIAPGTQEILPEKLTYASTIEVSSTS